ncbi:MAG: hypothetical protein EXR73_07430 [Myxococcales bacterium]|nr:hypothetical protein [Myxococcales bacterium]
MRTTILLAALLCAASPVFAEEPATSTADTIEIELQILKDLEADPDDDSSWRAISSQESAEYWNRMKCECQVPVRLELRKTLRTPSNGPVEVWLGANCGVPTDTTRDTRCKNFASFTFGSGSNSVQHLVVPANQLMWPPAGECLDDEAQKNVFAIIDEGTDGDLSGALDSVSTLVEEIDVDSEVPPAPTALTLLGAEDAVVIEWELPSANVADLREFQALCRHTGTLLPIYAIPPAPAGYDQCPGAPIATGPDAGVPDAGLPDAAPPDAAPPADAGPPVDAAVTTDGGPDGGVSISGWDTLDPSFLCSASVSGTDTSIRIAIPPELLLGPDDEIEVRLLVVDDHSNVLALDVGTARPQPVHDFWEVYEDLGGGAEGGFCFIATAAYGDYDHPFVRVLRDFRDGSLLSHSPGRAFVGWYYRVSPPLAAFIAEHEWARVGTRALLWPVVVTAGAWEYTSAGGKLLLLLATALAALLVPRLRRRVTLTLAPRRAALAGVAAAAVIALVLLGWTGTASAQVIYDAEWDDHQSAVPALWTFEMKFGPYRPNIDGEFSAAPGPYELTFGTDWSLLTQFELDRYFVHRGGALGVGLSIGYLSNSAAAFLEDGDGNPLYLEPRSEADDTAFKLMPTALIAVYRSTWFADHTVVPLIPYVKAGLAWYVWWVTKGDDMITMTDTNGSAAGATLGWQATVGLALRADRLDPGAARSLQSEMGIEHSNFFIEATKAEVSGLAQTKRLHVGDTTWSAGIAFDF